MHGKEVVEGRGDDERSLGAVPDFVAELAGDRCVFAANDASVGWLRHSDWW